MSASGSVYQRNTTGKPGATQSHAMLSGSCNGDATVKHRQVNCQIGEEARAGVHPLSDKMRSAIPCFNLPAPDVASTSVRERSGG